MRHRDCHTKITHYYTIIPMRWSLYSDLYSSSYVLVYISTDLDHMKFCRLINARWTQFVVAVSSTVGHGGGSVWFPLITAQCFARTIVLRVIMLQCLDDAEMLLDAFALHGNANFGDSAVSHRFVWWSKWWMMIGWRWHSRLNVWFTITSRRMIYNVSRT